MKLERGHTSFPLDPKYLGVNGLPVGLAIMVMYGNTSIYKLSQISKIEGAELRRNERSFKDSDKPHCGVPGYWWYDDPVQIEVWPGTNRDMDVIVERTSSGRTEFVFDETAPL